MPGFPVHHHLPEFAQTHVHRVDEAIQPSHPLSAPSPSALNLSQQQDLLELTPQKYVLFIIGAWNAKVGSQETPGVTGKFGLGIWNEAEQSFVLSFAKKMHWS